MEKSIKLEDFIPQTAVSTLNALLDAKNIEMKTVIANPRKLALLKMRADRLISQKLPKSAKPILDFIQNWLLYAVSKDGRRSDQIVSGVVAEVNRNNLATTISSDNNNKLINVK